MVAGQPHVGQLAAVPVDPVLAGVGLQPHPLPGHQLGRPGRRLRAETLHRLVRVDGLRGVHTEQPDGHHGTGAAHGKGVAVDDVDDGQRAVSVSRHARRGIRRGRPGPGAVTAAREEPHRQHRGTDPGGGPGHVVGVVSPWEAAVVNFMILAEQNRSEAPTSSASSSITVRLASPSA